MKGWTRQIILALVVIVAAVSLSPITMPTAYNSLNAERASGLDVVSNSGNGIIEIPQSASGVQAGQTTDLITIRNSMDQSLTVTVTLSTAQTTGWGLSNGQYSRTVTLQPGAEEVFSVNVDNNNQKTSTQYTVRATQTGGLFFDQQRSVAIEKGNGNGNGNGGGNGNGNGNGNN